MGLEIISFIGMFIYLAMFVAGIKDNAVIAVVSAVMAFALLLLGLFASSREGKYLNDDCSAQCGAQVVVACKEMKENQALAVCKEDTKGNVSGHLFERTKPPTWF